MENSKRGTAFWKGAGSPIHLWGHGEMTHDQSDLDHSQKWTTRRSTGLTGVRMKASGNDREASASHDCGDQGEASAASTLADCRCGNMAGPGSLACSAVTSLRRRSCTPIPVNDFTPDSRQGPYELDARVRICAGGDWQQPSVPRCLKKSDHLNVSH